MSKKQWPDNSVTYLTAPLMRAYWGTSAATGHTHNGTDTDGDCPKIFNTPTEIPMELIGATGVTFNIAYTKNGFLVCCHVPGVTGLTSTLHGLVGFSAQPIGSTFLPDDLRPRTGEFIPSATTHHCAMVSSVSGLTYAAGVAFFDFDAQDALYISRVNNSDGSTGPTCTGWYPFSMTYISKT